MSPMYKILTGWCQTIHNSLDPVMRQYNEWPVALVLRVAPLFEKGKVRKIEAVCDKRMLSSKGFF
jgi:hypothetical protein